MTLSDNVVAVHQPNFFPWLGFFDKIARAGAFVLLDDAQFQKTGGTWINRVKVLINGEGRWITAPVERAYHGVRDVKDIVLDASQPWRGTMLKTLETSYRRAPRFTEAMALLEPLIRNPERQLARYNGHAIIALLEALNLRGPKIHWASEFGVDATGTERLIGLIKALRGSVYLCGGGADGYQDDGAFARAEIVLQYQNFAHPTYAQHSTRTFVSGLSIIDALMNLGVAGTRALFMCQ